MKLRNLFVAAVAAVFALWSCEEEKPTLGIEVSSNEVHLYQVGGGESIDVITYSTWTAIVPEAAQDWLTVYPPQGKGNTTVVFSAGENDGKERSATVQIKAGYDIVPVTVTQDGKIASGDGLTMETAFSASEARAWINSNLASGEVTATKYFVKGFIHKIGTYQSVEQYFASNSYGNATFYMSDDGQASEQDFEAYQVNYLGNRAFDKNKDTDIKVGDEVIVYGPLTLYNTTPETAGKGAACLVKLNDVVVEPQEPQTPETGEPQGAGTVTNPFNVAAAIDAVKNLTWTSNTEYDEVGPYFVAGKVVEIKENFDATATNGTQYGNATFYIADEGYESTRFYCYRVKYFNNQAWQPGNTPLLEVGDYVVVCSKLMNYRGNTPETVANSGYMICINDLVGTVVDPDTPGPGPGGDDVNPAGDGSVNNPFNVAAAVNAVANLTWTSNTDYQKVGPFYVKGKVSSISQNFDASGEYGNATFDLVDVDGSSTKLTCYRILYFEGKKYTAGQAPLPAVGSEVIIYSELMNYRGNTPETVANAGSVYSIDGKTAAEGGNTPPTPPATEDPKAVTIAEFNAAEESQTQPYILVGKMSNITSTVYGNFDLTDASGTVYVYGLTATNLGYGAQNDKSFANLGLAEGDEIKIIGYRGSYGEKIEVVSAYFVEKVGGETPPEPPVDETLSVSEILALAKDTACDSKPSLVVALTARGFVATDGSKNIYVYTQGTNFNGIAKIGDSVKFSGVKTEYSNMPEVTPVTALEVVSSNNNVVYPNPRDITDVAGTYTATEAEFISLTGTLSVSGNYYNLALDAFADGSKMGSIVYPAEYLKAADYAGKKITVTGYFNGLTGSNKYINVIATKIEEVSGGQTGGDPVISNFQASFYQFGLSVSWDATEGAASYEWNLYNSSGAKVAMGATDQTSMRSDFGEVSVSMETGFGVAWYADSGSLNGKYLKYGTYTLTLKANVPGYSNEVSKTITLENEEGVLTVTKLVGTDTGFEAEWAPYTGADFSHYYWELHIVGENNQTSRAITGCTTDPYVRNLPTQTSYVDETHNTSWLVDGMVQGAKYYFIVVALAPKQSPNDEGNWPLASSAGRDHFTFGATYEPKTVTVDFTAKPCENFPTASGTTSGTYQFGGNTFAFSATTAFYWSSQQKALLIGKKDSFILFPKFEGIALKKVSFKTGNNASENVIVDVCEYIGGDNPTVTQLHVNSSKLSKGTEYTWEIPNSKNDTYYMLVIANAYNAQFQNLTLYYE